MKVQVYYGDNFVQVTGYVLQQASQQQSLAPTLVIVPDRFTLQAERIMLNERPQLLNTRVVTFSMLYQIVAEELNQGNRPVEVLDKTSAVLYLWSAIKQVQGDLQWFQKSVSHYDFAEKMFNTLNEIRSSGVDVLTLPGQAQTAVAQKKYHDIALIYQKYGELLGNRTDSSGMLSYLIDHLAESEFVKSATFYLCGFENLSPSRLKVLQEVGKYASTVTIGVATQELREQLKMYPQKRLPTTPYTPAEEKEQIETPRQEAIAVAEKIVALINQGVAPEKIVVLLTEFETLAPVWAVVFGEYQIPVNIDVGEKLSETAVAKYVRDLLELALADNSENTLAVLFNACSGVGDARFELENNILRQGLRAHQVPDVPQLSRTNDVKKLVAELIRIVEQCSNQPQQIVDKVSEILQKIATFVAETPLTVRELANLFWTLCSATKISNIPLYLDRVLIANVDEWVASPIQYLFIANCTEDNFPKGQDDNDILQEVDLTGTKIVPTPTQQRWRNYVHAQLMKATPSVGLRLSGANKDYPVGATRYYPRRGLYHDDQPISVGRKLFLPYSQVSPTLLENYYRCPALNFWEKGLHLAPRRLHKIEVNDIGSAIHRALQEYFGGGTVAQAVKVGVAELQYDCPPLENALRKEIRYLIERLENSKANSKFQVWRVEEEIRQPLKPGLSLVGRVDRIDTATDADGNRVLLVIDYKTGTPPSKILTNIGLGCKLQLPLYATALSKQGSLAGAGYLSLPGSFGNEGKELTLRGLLTADYRDYYPADLVPSKPQFYYDAPTFSAICNYAWDKVLSAVADLEQGIVRAQAVDKETCKYCLRRSLCTKAEVALRGEGVTYKKEDFMGVKND